MRRARYLPALAHQFHLTPRDVDLLTVDEFDLFAACVDQIAQDMQAARARRR